MTATPSHLLFIALLDVPPPRGRQPSGITDELPRPGLGGSRILHSLRGGDKHGRTGLRQRPSDLSRDSVCCREKPHRYRKFLVWPAPSPRGHTVACSGL